MTPKLQFIFGAIAFASMLPGVIGFLVSWVQGKDLTPHSVAANVFSGLLAVCIAYMERRKIGSPIPMAVLGIWIFLSGVQALSPILEKTALILAPLLVIVSGFYVIQLWKTWSTAAKSQAKQET